MIQITMYHVSTAEYSLLGDLTISMEVYDSVARSSDLKITASLSAIPSMARSARDVDAGSVAVEPFMMIRLSLFRSIQATPDFCCCDVKETF